MVAVTGDEDARVDDYTMIAERFDRRKFGGAMLRYHAAELKYTMPQSK